jgi:rod shape-determining protein MreD
VVLRRVRLVLLVVTLVVLENTVFRHLRVFDAIPSLCLIATVAIAYEEGPHSGAIFGFVSGLAIDMLLSGTPVGLSALSFALTGYTLGVLQGGLVRDVRGISPLLALAGGLVGGTIFLVVGGIAGVDGFFTLTRVRIVVVAAVYDAVVAGVVFKFTRWANHDPDRARGW